MYRKCTRCYSGEGYSTFAVDGGYNMLALLLVTVAVDDRQVLQVCLAFRYSHPLCYISQPWGGGPGSVGESV